MKIFLMIKFEMYSINTLESLTGFLILPFLLSFQSSVINPKNISAGTIAVVGKAMIYSKTLVELRKSRLLKSGLSDNSYVSKKYLMNLSVHTILIKKAAKVFLSLIGNFKNFKKIGQ